MLLRASNSNASEAHHLRGVLAWNDGPLREILASAFAQHVEMTSED